MGQLRRTKYSFLQILIITNIIEVFILGLSNANHFIDSSFTKVEEKVRI